MIDLPKGFKLRAGAEWRGALPRAVERISLYLDKVKYEEVLTTFQVGQAIGISANTMHHHSAHPHLADYRFNMQEKIVLWGSKRTIAKLKKQLEKA